MKPDGWHQDLVCDGGAMRYDARRVADPGLWLFDASEARLKAMPVSRGGRLAAWFVENGFGQGVLRHYRRGGLIAKISADRYIWTGAASTRSFAEFDLLRFMYDQGLPVPRPIAAGYWRGGVTYRAAILIERIIGVQPLADVLALGNQAAVARAIFDMHEAGVWHSDLNAYNILLDDIGKVWLIDFDKCRRQHMSSGRRRANLLRLRRSLEKLAGQDGISWWRELNHAYQLLV